MNASVRDTSTRYKQDVFALWSNDNGFPSKEKPVLLAVQSGSAAQAIPAPRWSLASANLAGPGSAWKAGMRLLLSLRDTGVPNIQPGSYRSDFFFLFFFFFSFTHLTWKFSQSLDLVTGIGTQGTNAKYQEAGIVGMRLVRALAPPA